MAKKPAEITGNSRRRKSLGDGLFERTTATGHQSYLIRYVLKGEKQNRYETLPGGTSRGDAKNRARAVQDHARRGIDLIAKEKEEQRQAEIRRQQEQPHTLAAVVETFIRRDLEAKGRAPSYVKATRAYLDKHVVQRWGGDRDLRTITRPEIVTMLDSIVDAGDPVLANRTLAATRALMNWSVRRGLIDQSPCYLVERPSEETPRDRVLSSDEIRTLWTAFDKAGEPLASYFRMLLITAQRRGEVAKMRWADLDLTEHVWTLSASATKARRAHVVPLPQIAIDILQAMSKLGPYVFTTQEDGSIPISGYSKGKARVDRAAPEIAAWTVHDLRRSAASGLGRLGISRFVIGRVLNHADKSVTAIYDQWQYLPEKRHALEAWAAHLDNLINPSAANVVPLRS